MLWLTFTPSSRLIGARWPCSSRACQAVSQIITRAIEDGQSDGTYTALAWGWLARMIKGALLGVAAIVAVIAGEMGADKVLAMREGRSTAAVIKGDGSAQDP